MQLSTPLKEITGNRFFASAAKALSKLGVLTVQDLLFYMPLRYLDFSKFSDISKIKAGEVVTIRAKIKTIGSRFSFKTKRSLSEAIVSDDTGSIKVTWFNQGYLAKSLKQGQELLLSGKVEQYKGLQMINPVHELVTLENIHTGRIVPVYRVTEGLYHRTIRNLVNSSLPAAMQLKDALPDFIQKDKGLLSLTEAIENIHFPRNEEKLEEAKRRFIFEEVFVQQLAVAKHRLILRKQAAPAIPQNISLIKTFLGTLPFELTVSQKKALWDIVQDLEKPLPMNRLLEGDVGSGKTIVAQIAALETSLNGYQVAIIAPTEILAQQHFENFCSSLKQYKDKIKVGLLTSSFHLIDQEETSKQFMLSSIKVGAVNIIIGTHALLQSNVHFKKLGLIVVDEQHRFGVKQRALLQKNTREGKNTAPHLLSMSATPIPRTLALSLYGDLNISTLKEMPKGRQKVTSQLVAENQRAGAYTFIQKELTKGRQVFIVTPRVEDSEEQTLKSAKKEFKRLSEEIFPESKLGLLYGSMKGVDKEKIMSAFYAGEIDILVSTSVIEIGIDVPNATVMLIEGSENFGLAQLHQLRGRVGRGQGKSYCLLFTDSQDEKALQRLNEFCEIHDGFTLAEMDLKQRGFGSLFGTEQTGFKFKFSQYLNIKILESAKKPAEQLITQDPELKTYPLLKKQVGPLLEQIHLE